MRDHDEWRGGAPRDGDDPALDRFAERVAAPLRAAERADAAFSARVMDAVRAEARDGAYGVAASDARHVRLPARAAHVPAIAPAPRPRLPWYRRSVTVRVTPLSGLAAAAALAAVAYLGARATIRAGGAGDAASSSTAVAASPPAGAPLSDTVRVVQFVYVAPTARRVALVGDFNAWDRNATELRRGGVGGGVWTVSLALPAGRHEYAFVVDGTRWEPDPAATTAVRDDFGVVSSVVSVSGPRTPARSPAGTS